MRLDPNIRRLERTLAALAEIADEGCLVGGCVAGLLITDPGADAVRATFDVDLVVEVIPRPAYQMRYGKRMRELGFQEGTEEGDPTCRWRSGDLVVDLIPLDPDVLGFGNRWYASGVEHAVATELPGGQQVRHINAAHFLATKLEAFLHRGEGDSSTSHDLEDVMRVIDGRRTIVEEVRAESEELRRHVEAVLQQCLDDPYFVEALPEYFQGEEDRGPIVLERVRQILASG